MKGIHCTGNQIYIVCVPCKADKDFDLPTHLTGQISNKLDIPNGSHFVHKTAGAKSQKDVPTDKRDENIKGAFAVSTDVSFKDKVVTIVDDIYDTGSTINELGRVLKQVGAKVQGITATRINRRSYHDLP